MRFHFVQCKTEDAVESNSQDTTSDVGIDFDKVTFQMCASLSSPRMTRSECIEHPHCPASFNRCKLTLWCFPKPDSTCLTETSLRRSSVQQDVEISRVALWTVHKHAIDRHQLSPPSRLDCVCQKCSCHYASHNSRSPLLILFPPLKLSKRMLSRGGSVTVSGQILTHASCCETVTVANYIFTQWRKHNLGNIRMDGKNYNIANYFKKNTLCKSLF